MAFAKECAEYVGNAIEIVERNIKAPLSLRGISRDVGISEYHLHRVFKALTGHSLMSYVRGRKLSMCLHDLLDTQMNIIDIAYEYGFHYEQSFERAFRKQFTVSPSAVRRDRPDLAVTSIPDLCELYDVGQGALAEPAFILKPRFHLAGIESEIIHRQNYDEATANKAGREFFFGAAAGVPGRKNDHVYYGLIRYSSNPAYSNFYMPSVEVSGSARVSPPLVLRALPTHTYAMFRYIGFHAPTELSIRSLLSLYDFIDRTLPLTRYRQADAYHFERIDLHTCGSDYCEADIYYPIESNIG